MKRHLRWLKVAASVFLGVILFAVMMWGIDASRLWMLIAQSSPLWFLVSGAATLVSNLVRALRWKMLLESMKNSIGVSDAFWMVSAGNLVNFLIPLRIGEFLRSYLMSKKAKIGLSDSLSSIVIERLMDLSGLIALALLALLFFPNQTMPDWLFCMVGVAVMAVLTAVLLTLIGSRWAIQLLGTLPLPSSWNRRLFGFLRSLTESVAGVACHPVLFLSIVMCTAGVWMLQLVAVYLIFVAFGYWVSGDAVLLGFAIMQLTLIVPTTPGRLGTFEVFWTGTFLSLGVLDYERLFATSVAAHLFYSLITVVFGGVATMQLGLSFSELLNVEKHRVER